jgi:hypothetical protein
MLTKDDLTKALMLLSEMLDNSGHPNIHLVVCGGSSLIITGMVARVTTKDIDVLGFLEKSEAGKDFVKSGKPLPQWLANAAQKVANSLGLDSGWFNAGPADLNKWGLPEGLVQRLQTMKFGNHLTVHFLSRLDQIHFKTYAAADSGPGRHYNDLVALNPTEDEIEMGAKWALTQDPSEAFKSMVKKMLEVMEFGKASQRI